MHIFRSMLELEKKMELFKIKAIEAKARSDKLLFYLKKVTK